MPSKEAAIQHFGLVIAYVLPGLTALWGGSYFSETLRAWLATSPEGAPTVAGFLYMTLASIATGLAHWFQEQKAQIDSLPIDDRVKRTHVANLNERYAELTSKLLESMEPGAR